MERYRAELLSYQRATPPGRPTLAQMREGSEMKKSPPPPAPAPPVVVEKLAAPPEEFVPEPLILPKNPAAVISDPMPMAITKPKPGLPSEPSPAQIVGFAASIAADFTAGIIAAANSLPGVGRAIVAEAKAEETAAEQPIAESFHVDIEERRAALAKNLATVSEAQVISPRCVGCATDIEEQIQNAPSRHRTLLPDETAPLPTCPCGLDDACQELPELSEEASPAPPEESPTPLLLPTPSLPTLPEESPAPLLLPTPVPPIQACDRPPEKKPACSPSECLCCGHTEYEKGIGAYGTFQPYERMDHLTHAAFLQKPGEAVKVLARFAADLPSGGADACRCRRSFSVKFFCKDGEYDLLGQHLPVTVGCEQQAVLACCSTTRPDPATGLRSRSRFWEYVAENPVALHAAVWLYSDLGTIGSYRAIDGYCSPSVWVGAHGKRKLARCCWLSRQRPQTLTRFESEELCGYDPDAVARDFVTAITRGEFPQYELAVQLLDPEQELPFDPYDPTLIWPQEIASPRRIGLMTLDRLPETIAGDLDAKRFSAEHLIDGIEAAPPALPAEGRELMQAGDRLRGLGERERRRLIDNLIDELSALPADLLEQILILFSKADLGFGQALTTALGG